MSINTMNDVTKTYNRRRGLDAQEESSSALRRPINIKRRRRQLEEDDALKLNILLPNGGSVILYEDRDHEMKVEELLRRIKLKAIEEEDGSGGPIKWGSHVFLEDTLGRRIEDAGMFKLIHTLSRTLVLQDGQPNAVHALQDMWNVTPDPELLGALPQEYTLETALADILDNSLQAVWSNINGDRRLISITLSKDKITIFDSGQGMDSSTSNSIAKWGTMGSSNHRSVRTSAIGGDPPFLKPCFGMYGFGGLVAALHLGGVAVVSSKTKSSKYVVTLTLEKDQLMERCKIDRTWKTPGEFREPTKEETRKSPHGSFTKVELSKLKKKKWNEHQLMCMLKDIYFPYIQCDIADSSQKTTTPVEFEVNVTNLAEVEGGEVAVTNMFSCNGAPFIIDIHLNKTSHDAPSGVDSGNVDQGNARVTCFYYPIKQGKETIENILEELEKQEMGINENFENFCRVAIRRLGRLLPDARWRRLPFMEPKRKRDKIAIPKVCFERVKAFIDTDAGFVPTTSKMDLSSGHSFTNALKNLGSRGITQDGVAMGIVREQRPLKADQLEKEFQEWVRDMHEFFDEEVDCEMEPDLIIPCTIRELGFCQDVFRVYKRMQRKGVVWKQGMRVKFLKGIPGYQKKNFYATLEYFLSEGLSEDRGSTQVICRPIEALKEDGSTVSLKDDNASFDLGKSKALSIDLFSSEKCSIVTESDWKRYAEKRNLKYPACIEILDKQSAEMLGLGGGLELRVKAGSKLPYEIAAVVRPKHYTNLIQDGKHSNPICQKSIVKQPMQMRLEVKYMASKNFVIPKESMVEQLEKVYAAMPVKGKNVNGVQSFYCFNTEGTRLENLFTKTGRYIFSFSLEPGEFLHEMITTTLEVHVVPSGEIGRWDLHISGDKHVESQNDVLTTRLGSEIGPLVISCYDEYDNLKEINEPIDFKFVVWSNEKLLNIDMNIERGSQEGHPPCSSLTIKAIKFTKGSLKGVATDYAACLKLLISNSCAAALSLFVLPGEMACINALDTQLVDNCLQTGDIIHVMTLQVLDSYGNYVERGCQVFLKLYGLELQDSQGHHRMVDERGCINLGGLLRVTGCFNSKAKISAYSPKEDLLYEREFALLQRSMHIMSLIPKECKAGSILENIEVQIVDANGHVDKKMDGPRHMIMVDACSYNAYPLREGTCSISTVQLPSKPGPWCCRIYHSMNTELQSEIKVNIICAFSPTSGAYTPEDDDPVLQIHDKNGAEREVRTMAENIITNIETMRKVAERNATKASKAEEELSKLQTDKNNVIHQMSQLKGDLKILEQQAHGDSSSVNNDIDDLDQIDYTAQHIAKRIMGASHPARFFMPGRFLSYEGDNPLVKEILGVVSLLAAVENQLLSKALAEVIGEENMLAVVCKTPQAAGLIERYDEFDGKVDESRGLYKYTQSEKKNMNGRLRVYILQEMRFYACGHESNHSQYLLKIEAPQLGNGVSPDGFLGYAVNLLYLNREHLVQGLRGTLFYHLFEKLQVYDTRKHLIEAKDALTSGGISLDGGLIRDKGCIDFGVRQEEMISFPITSKSQKYGLPSLHHLDHFCRSMQIKDTLRCKKKELQEKHDILSATEERAQHVRQKLHYYKKQYETALEGLNSQGHMRSQLEEKLSHL